MVLLSCVIGALKIGHQMTQKRGRKRIVRQHDETPESIEEATGISNDCWNHRKASTGSLSKYVGTCRRNWGRLIAVGCAIILAFVVGGEVYSYISADSLDRIVVHLIAENEMIVFETFLDVMTSTTHEDNVRAVVHIPAVFQQTRLRLDHATRVILSSDLFGQDWQEVIVRDAKRISHLLHDTAEDMFDYLLRGRTMMTYMIDIGLHNISKAFHDGEYSIVLQVLENMEQHIQNADASVTTARGKMRDSIELAENVLESMQKKVQTLLLDAKEADKGWNTETKLAVYGLAMALTVVTGAVAVPFIGVGAGLTAAGGTATIGGGAAIMKHWFDIADGEELKQRLQSDAHMLEDAYQDMSVVRDNLEHVSMYIRQLRIAVEDAEKSVSGLHGQLHPSKAAKFYYRLTDLAHKCIELHTLYKRAIEDYRAKDWHQQQQKGPQAIDLH